MEPRHPIARQPIEWHLESLEAIARFSVRVADEVTQRIEQVRRQPSKEAKAAYPDDIPVVQQMIETTCDERLAKLTRVFERIARGVRLSVALDLKCRDTAPIRTYAPRALAEGDTPPREADRPDSKDRPERAERESYVERDPVLIHRATPSKLRDFLVETCEEVGLDVMDAPELRDIPPHNPKRVPPHRTTDPAPKVRRLVPF